MVNNLFRIAVCLGIFNSDKQLVRILEQVKDPEAHLAAIIYDCLPYELRRAIRLLSVDNNETISDSEMKSLADLGILVDGKLLPAIKDAGFINNVTRLTM